MKVKLKENGTIHEVFGIVILDNQKKLFLLYSNFEVLDTELEIIDGRMPFDWHWKVISKEWCKIIIGPQKLTKNLIYAAYHWEGEEALKYKKLQSDEIKKNWQKNLEYYDEVLNYSNIFDNMLYKFER
ncbi:hypothetical protein [Leptotrichia wadei]|uniref:hypothetical protein n=1 Tax=Leptotrichia wadei TaxID=157687 RepID=UPI0028D791A2|nr:hypothetical protein [Leptotrichia wadei]